MPKNKENTGKEKKIISPAIQMGELCVSTIFGVRGRTDPNGNSLYKAWLKAENKAIKCKNNFMRRC